MIAGILHGGLQEVFDGGLRNRVPSHPGHERMKPLEKLQPDGGSLAQLIGPARGDGKLASITYAATPGVPTQDDTRVQEPAVGTDEPRKDETHPVSAYFTDIWDNAGADVLERMRTTTSPEWDVLGEHVVSEAMSSGVRSVQAHDSLADAAAYMLDERIHRALVLDGDRLVGIVAAIDFLRAIAGREPRRA